MTTETPKSELNEHADSTPIAEVEGFAAEDSKEIYLLDLLLVIAERKQIVFWFTVAFALLAIVASQLAPNIYTATVTLLPPQQNSSMSGTMASQLNSLAALAGGGLGVKNPNDMYIAMFKSRTVEEGVVTQFDLQQQYHTRSISDAARAFEASSTVEAGAKDGLLRVSVKDRDQRRAAQLANGYIDQFRLLSESLAVTEASQRRLFFERELNKAKDNLATAEEDMRKMEQTSGVIEIDSQTRALIAAASGLRAQIDAKEVQIQGMRTYATGENAQLVQAQQELASMRAQLSSLGGSEYGANAGLIVPKGKVPEASLQYIRKLRDVKYNETIFEILARQFEAAKLDEAKQGALIQVLDPAVPPEHRTSPRRGLMVIVGTVLGFFLGVVVAMLQAGYNRLKENPEAVGKLGMLRRALVPAFLWEVVLRFRKRVNLPS